MEAPTRSDTPLLATPAPAVTPEWLLQKVVGLLNRSPEFVKRHPGWVDDGLAAGTEEVKDSLQTLKEELEIWEDNYDKTKDWVDHHVPDLNPLD